MINRADVTFENGELALTGDLDFSNVRHVFEKGVSQFNKHPQLVFNFSGLKTSNSAGIALMIEWLRAAKSANKIIKFQHVSPALQSIAKAAGLEEILFK